MEESRRQRIVRGASECTGAPVGGRDAASGRRPGIGAGFVSVRGQPGCGPIADEFALRVAACKFCVDKIDYIDYKDAKLLGQFISERGKIVPRRLSGVCTPCQGRLSEAIKQARNIALLPFQTTL